MTVIKIPKKVLEDMRWNAQHGKCSLCMRICALVEDDKIDASKLSRDQLNHLKYAIEAYQGKRPVPIL